MKKLLEILPKRYVNKTDLQIADDSSLLKAYDQLLEKSIVIKYIDSSSVYAKSFFQEFILLKQFRHPNIIQVYDFGSTATKSFFYTMPYYDLVNPIQYCREKKQIGILEIMYQILCGLQFLHKRQIIHGDLSLDNLLFTKDGENLKLIITDFGLTSLLKNSSADSPFGSVQYIAPELLSGSEKKKATVEADLYAVGIILYELIYGNSPFYSDKSLDILKSHIKDDVPFPELPFPVDADLLACIKKLLEKEPAKRYSSCQSLLKDLLPLFKKYNLIQEASDYYWQDVLKEIRKNRKIQISYYREKVIQKIKARILHSKSKWILIQGSESNLLEPSIEFLTSEFALIKTNCLFIDEQTLMNEKLCYQWIEQSCIEPLSSQTELFLFTMSKQL